MNRFVDIPLLKATMFAHFAHSSSRMTFTSKLSRWTKRVIFETLGTIMLTRDCANAINVQKSFPKVIETLTELLEVERCAAFMYDEEEDQIYIRAISGMNLTTSDLSFKRNGIFDEIFDEPAGYIHVPYIDPSDQAHDASVIDAAVNSKTRNQLLIALKEPTGKVIGFLEIANKKHGQQFSQLDLHLLKLVAKSLAKGLAIYERGEILVSLTNDKQKEKYDRQMDQINHIKSTHQQQFMVPFVSAYLNTLSFFLSPQSKIYLMVKEGKYFTQFPDTNTYSSEHLVQIPTEQGILGVAHKARRKIVETGCMEALHEEEKKLCTSNQVAVILIKNLQNEDTIADTGLHLDESDEVLGALFISLPEPLTNSQKRKLPHYANVLSKIIDKQLELNGIVINQALMNGAFNCLNQGLLWFNHKLTFTKVNLAGAEMLGKKPHEIVDRSLEEVLGDNNNYVKRRILEAVEGSGSFNEDLATWYRGQERVPMNIHLAQLDEDLTCFLLILQPVLLKIK